MSGLSRDDIIRMAREAGLADGIELDREIAEFERFAELVAAAEREACAQICDAYGMPDGTSETARLLANQIRARGNNAA